MDKDGHCKVSITHRIYIMQITVFMLQHLPWEFNLLLASVRTLLTSKDLWEKSKNNNRITQHKYTTSFRLVSQPSLNLQELQLLHEPLFCIHHFQPPPLHPILLTRQCPSQLINCVLSLPISQDEKQEHPHGSKAPVFTTSNQVQHSRHHNTPIPKMPFGILGMPVPHA